MFITADRKELFESLKSDLFGAATRIISDFQAAWGVDKMYFRTKLSSNVVVFKKIEYLCI